MRLISAILCRNEADRYLQRVIERCGQFSDEILVLDDGSTDGSVELAKSLGCLVKQRTQTGAWGNESPARAELWDRAVKLAKDGWILVNDADQVLHGDPRPLCETWEANSWAFILLDLWSETHHRVDGFWQASRTPRPWLVRPSAFGPGFVPQWSGRGVHTGHLPSNAPLACLVAPTDLYWWSHLAYATPEQRIAKHAKYLSVQDQLTPMERAHADSILDA